MRCLALLALLAACSPPESKVTSAATTFIDSDGGGNVVVDGVRIEMDGSVHFSYRCVSSTPGKAETSMTINGNPFGVRKGVFFVGDREYGAVAEGALVRVTSDGVTVDGEKRGPLPAPR